MFKTFALASVALASVVALAGCSSSNVPDGMVPVSTNVSTVKPLSSEEAAKELAPYFDASVKAFALGGSQAVHISDNGTSSSNIVAVNPTIFKGMVRMAVQEGKITDPRADEKIETQLDLMFKMLSSEDLGSTLVKYSKNGSTAEINDGKNKYTVYLIDGKVNKIVSESLQQGSPVKINYVYTYGDHSYDEAIQIVVDAAINGVFH